MKRTWTVDSIEEGIAAVEAGEGEMIHVPSWLLPEGAREGDVVSLERKEARGSVTLRLRIDRAATEAAHRASRDQLARLRPTDGGGGDVQL